MMEGLFSNEEYCLFIRKMTASKIWSRKHKLSGQLDYTSKWLGKVKSSDDYHENMA